MTKEQIRKSCIHTLREYRKSTPSGKLPPLHPKTILSLFPSNPTQILLYIATPLEPKTTDLIHSLFTHTSHEIFIPNTSDLSPAFTHLTRSTLLTKTSIRTYEEPSPKRLFQAIDFSPTSICIIPCLGATSDNYRLGYGSGFYDRFLSDFSGTTVGIVYHKNIVNFTTEAHDIPLDTILTW